jgi:hypothetical protein
MHSQNPNSSLTRFINFITFIDLPIRKKFLLFACGTLFWFFIIFLVFSLALLDLEEETGNIVNRVLPQEQAAQQIIRDFQQLGIDALETARETDVADIMLKEERARGLMRAITNRLSIFKDSEALRQRSQLKRIMAGAKTDTSHDIKMVEEIGSAAARATTQFAELASARRAFINGDTNVNVVHKLGEVRKTLKCLDFM